MEIDKKTFLDELSALIEAVGKLGTPGVEDKRQKDKKNGQAGK